MRVLWNPLGMKLGDFLQTKQGMAGARLTAPMGQGALEGRGRHGKQGVQIRGNTEHFSGREKYRLGWKG